MFDISKLNPEQQAAVSCIHGPLMILAGAGTGKTRVITCRIANMLSRGISSSEITAVTFTNKAAKEMKERLKSMLGEKQKAPRMGTFHSLCLDILRKYHKEADLPPKFSIAASSDQIDLVRRGLEERNWHAIYPAEKIQAAISMAKNSLLTPEHMKKYGVPESVRGGFEADVVAEAYELYERQLKLNRVIDFDDCILRCFLLLSNNQNVREKIQQQIKFILVDEFQDTNMAQLQLLHLIAEHHRNICVVGDDDQSIYSWRGAVAQNLTTFENMFPGTVQIKLEQNYRCSNLILDAANAVIKNNKARKDKTLWSSIQSEHEILLQEFEDEVQEARWIAQKIYAFLGKGIEPDQIAVLYRANNQARAIELALREHHVHYKVFGGQSFFERKEIKDFLAYVRLVVHPDDRLAFWRAINSPPRGIGLKSLEAIDQLCQERNCSPYKVIKDYRLNLAPRIQEVSDHFCSDLELLQKDLREHKDIEGCFKQLIKIFKLEEYIKLTSSEPEAAHRKIEALRKMPKFLADAYLKEKSENSDCDIFEILDQLTTGEYEPEMEKNKGRGAVSLMTIHAAKGLEFQCVLVAGLEDGVIPHKNSAGLDHGVAEERRLFYVALTRAKQHLCLSYSLSKSIGKDKVPKIASRFLKEIPEEILSKKISDTPINPEEYKRHVKESFARRLADFKSSLRT